MFKSLSTSLIWRGILAVAVGVVALAWPQVTVLALVILFAVFAFARWVRKSSMWRASGCPATHPGRPVPPACP